MFKSLLLAHLEIMKLVSHLLLTQFHAAGASLAALSSAAVIVSLASGHDLEHLNYFFSSK